MPTERAANIQLLSTDLDGTLLGNVAACQRFRDAWSTSAAPRRPILVYNTGRSVRNTLALIHARDIPVPDHIIGGVGTEMHNPRETENASFTDRFRRKWKLAAVESIVAELTPAKKQPAFNQNAFKSSWTWARATPSELSALTRRLIDAGIDAHVEYSCRYFLDVVPADAGKGNALAWLCSRLGVPLETVLVAGDTGNDRSMFLLPGVRGVLVGNALPELRAAVVRAPIYAAQGEMADGLLEGLHYFGCLRVERGRQTAV